MQGVMRVLVPVFLSFLVVAGVLRAEEDFREVDLDVFIKQEKKAGEGKKLIRMAAPLRFKAALKRFPEERQLHYVYTALQMAGVDPLPEIGHRMFIESAEGRIIPVYVEKQAVEKVKGGLEEGQKADFLGYHVYTYSKGPAILVVDYVPVR